MTADLNATIINALEEVKGLDIISLDVTGLTDIVDTMIIVSGGSGRQVRALASTVIEDCKKSGFRPVGVEGMDAAEWVLVDFGDTVVHVMTPDTRNFYDLEKLWSIRPGDLVSMDNE
jgi:ribosome-associated protein